MLTSHRTIGKAMIIVFAIAFLFIVGSKAVKFADETANATQDRIDSAFAVLDSK